MSIYGISEEKKKRKQRYHYFPIVKDTSNCLLCNRPLVLARLMVVLYDGLNENKTEDIHKVPFCGSCGIPFVTNKDIAEIQDFHPGFHLEAGPIKNGSNKEQLVKKVTSEAIPFKNLPKGTIVFSGEYKNHSCGADNLVKYNFLIHGKSMFTNEGRECKACKRVIFDPRAFMDIRKKATEYTLAKDEMNWDEIFPDKKNLFLLNINQYQQHKCPNCRFKLTGRAYFFKNDNNVRLKRKNVLECNKCGYTYAKISSFENKPYSLYKFSYDYFQEEAFREAGKHIILKAGDFLTRHNVHSCIGKNHSMEDITARIKIVARDGKEYDYDVPAVRCDTCGKLYLLEKEYQKIIAKGVPLCSVVNNEYWRKSGSKAQWTESDQKGSVMFIHGYNVNANDDLTEHQRHSILRTLLNDDVLTKAEICAHLDMLIQRAEGQKLLQNAKKKWERDRNYIEEYNPAKETIRVNSITRKSYKTISAT